MADDDKELSSGICGMITCLNKLIFAAKTGRERNRLRDLREKYSGQLEQLIEKNIAGNTEEYAEALKSLQDARQEAVNAEKDIRKIARAIKYAAMAAKLLDKAIDTVGKVM